MPWSPAASAGLRLDSDRLSEPERPLYVAVPIFVTDRTTARGVVAFFRFKPLQSAGYEDDAADRVLALT